MAIEILPTKIVYVCREATEVRNHKAGKTIRARPAFPVNPLKKGTLNTARKWAGNKANSEGKYVANVEFEVDNVDITNIKIYDYEYRNNNSMVFKVVIDDKYIVDFRPEQVLDVMVNGTFDHGQVSEPMVWAVVGSQMTLVRANGEEVKNIRKQEKEILADIDKGIRTQSGAFKSLPAAEKKGVGFYKSMGDGNVVSTGKLDKALKITWTKRPRDCRGGRWGRGYSYYSRNQTVPDKIGVILGDFDVEESTNSYMNLSFAFKYNDKKKDVDACSIFTARDRHYSNYYSNELLKDIRTPDFYFYNERIIPSPVKSISAREKVPSRLDTMTTDQFIEEFVDTFIADYEGYALYLKTAYKDKSEEYLYNHSSNLPRFNLKTSKLSDFTDYDLLDAEISGCESPIELIMVILSLVWYKPAIRSKLYTITDPEFVRSLKIIEDEITAKLGK